MSWIVSDYFAAGILVCEECIVTDNSVDGDMFLVMLGNLSAILFFSPSLPFFLLESSRLPCEKGEGEEFSAMFVHALLVSSEVLFFVFNVRLWLVWNFMRDDVDRVEWKSIS